MSILCDVIVQSSATSKQLSALGDALWRWCRRTSGNGGIYPYLDSQLLADLISGKLPAPSQKNGAVDRSGVHVKLRDEESPDRQATIDCLRQEMPARGITDILVDGVSWDPRGPIVTQATAPDSRIMGGNQHDNF